MCLGGFESVCMNLRLCGWSNWLWVLFCFGAQMWSWMRKWQGCFIYLFLERGEGREKEMERSMECVVASHLPPTGDPAHNPDLCPDWESNCDPWVRRQVLSPLSRTSQG